MRFASFGFALGIFTLMPNEIGYQDIASLLARQPGVGERWQKRVTGAAATIQLATYSFGRPIGTSTPESATYRLASLDGAAPDVTGSIPRNSVAAGAALSAFRFPQGRSDVEGRSPRGRSAGLYRARDRPPGRDAVDLGKSLGLERVGHGRQDRDGAGAQGHIDGCAE